MALVRARQGCATSSRVIPAGAHIDDSDPIVVSNPQYFEPLEVVEAATAVPGEKRATRPRAAKAATAVPGEKRATRPRAAKKAKKA